MRIMASLYARIARSSSSLRNYKYGVGAAAKAARYLYPPQIVSQAEERIHVGPCGIVPVRGGWALHQPLPPGAAPTSRVVIAYGACFVGGSLLLLRRKRRWVEAHPS